MGWLTKEQIVEMGFLSVGSNVFLSDRASYYGANNIRIGDNVRIDDFCILSAGAGGIDIGSYVHIAAYTSLIGAGNIKLNNYANLSSRVSVFSSSDDYSGSSMTNPMIPDKYKLVKNESVFIGEHVIIGCGTVILPGAILNDGCAIGAMSFVNCECEKFTIFAGVPIREIKKRSHGLIGLANEFESYILNVGG